MTAAAEFARFAADLAWSDVPPAIRRKLQAHLLDTLAAITAGAATPEAATLLRCHGEHTGKCRVITHTKNVPPVDAALLNAFAGRRHTFDDTLEAGPIHPGSIIWAASLAAGEQTSASLTRVLTAALAGYELAVRLADAFGPGHYDAGFHGTGTCNAPAAGLAAAIAMGLDSARATHAINLAAAFASGTRQYQIDGALPHSAMNGARAAANGVQAAIYAAAGLDAPAGQLDGAWGLLRLHAAPPGSTISTADLGNNWEMQRLGLKPYPTCRFTHGPIAVLDELRHQHSLTAEMIEAIEIRTFAQSASVSDRPGWRDREEAILSHQFALATTLTDGPPALAALDRLTHNDAVRAMAARITVTTDPRLEQRTADAWPHHLHLTLRDGTELETFSPAPPGSLPDDDQSPAIRDKAASLLGPTRLAALRAVLAVPERHAISDLTALLGPHAV